MSPATFNKHHKDAPNAAAICWSVHKRIDFRTDEVELQHIIHELCHAYISYLYVENSNLSVDQFEEAICSLFANHGKLIIEQAHEIYNLLLPYKENS